MNNVYEFKVNSEKYELIELNQVLCNQGTLNLFSLSRYGDFEEMRLIVATNEDEAINIAKEHINNVKL